MENNPRKDFAFDLKDIVPHYEIDCDLNTRAPEDFPSYDDFIIRVFNTEGTKSWMVRISSLKFVNPQYFEMNVKIQSWLLERNFPVPKLIPLKKCSENYIFVDPEKKYLTYVTEFVDNSSLIPEGTALSLGYCKWLGGLIKDIHSKTEGFYEKYPHLLDCSIYEFEWSVGKI